MAVKSYKKNEQTLWFAMAKMRDRRGKQITRRQSGIATKEQALKTETKMKAELLAMREGKTRYRWNEWVKHCLKKMGLQFCRSTLIGYEANLQKWVNPILGNMWLENINPHDVHDVIFTQIVGTSLNTRKAVLKQVKRIFNMAMEEGLLARNPCLGLRVKVPQPRRLVLNQTEVSKLLLQGKRMGHPFFEHWVLASLTGMRNGELYALLWTDIDFGNRIISVNKSWSKFNGTGPTKSTMNRIVPISNELEKFLKEIRPGSKSEYVLKRSREWQMGNQAAVLKTFCLAIGITPIKFHDLRATFITQLLLRGVPVAKVMAIVGHADLKTTMHYVRLVGADIMGVTDHLGFEVPSANSERDNVITLHS